jgi:uncharacterized protein (TIRG00374 family)
MEKSNSATTMPRYLKTGLRILVAVLLTIFLVWLLRDWISLNRIRTVIIDAHFGLIGAGFLFYIVSYWLRAKRWQVFDIHDQMSLPNLFAITSIHTLVNNILPARTGELAYPYFQKKIQNVSVHQSLTSIVIVRMLDLAVIALLFSGAQAIFNIFPLQSEFKLLALGIFVGVILALIFLRKAIRLFSRVFIKLPKIQLLLIDTDKMIAEMQERDRFIRAAVWSLLAWLCKFVNFYLLLLAMGFAVTFPETIFGATLSELTTVLPVHGFAGIGTVEAGWTAGFGLSRILSMNDAVNSGFAVHFLFLLFSLILGVAGALMVIRIPNDKG